MYLHEILEALVVASFLFMVLAWMKYRKVKRG